MNENERKEIKEMVEAAKYLAKKDPLALTIVRSNIDILKARCDLAKQRQIEERR